MKHQFDIESNFIPMKRTKPRKSYDELESKRKDKSSWKEKRKQENRQRERNYSEFSNE